ncbi:MAG: polysaccharide deacetylase family protein [Acidobacteriota bacterium]
MIKALAGFRFMLASRGWRRGFRRAWLIWSRFGLTHRKMVRHLRSLVKILERHDAKATLFVPATVLADHRKALEAFRIPALEWGVHSDYHTDLSRMTQEEQEQHIGNAVALFDQADWPFVGFRAPYLKTEERTAGVLAATERFDYDSSPCVLRDEIYGKDATSYDWTMDFYRPELCSGRSVTVGEDESTLIRIPVSLPDDDILIDRDRRSPQQVFEVWSAMLQRSHELGEIFVLQLHPERGTELAEALSGLLAQARELSPPVWIPILAEVSEHARKRAQKGDEGEEVPRWPAPYQSVFCVTGDLDAMAIRDFVKRLRTW